MPPAEQKAVLHQREVHSILMELDRNKMNELQEKAIYLNYHAGEGRRLDNVPHSYEIPDGKGGYLVKETYYTFKEKVH